MMIELEDDKKKLLSATKSLEQLKKSLQASSENCWKIEEILTKFDDRLSKLEQTVQPVYHETGNLQKQQDNIVSSLNRLDYVIKFYTVAGDVGSTIISGPNSTTYDMYIRDLDRLSEAVRYFELNNSESPEMMNVTSLLKKGGENIEKEFRQLLSRHSSPMPVKNILELINNFTNSEKKVTSSYNGNKEDDNNDVESDTNDETKNKGSKKGAEENAHYADLPEKSRNDLKLLGNWLCMNRSADFIDIYARIRSEVLLKSLQNLKAYLKSSSLGTMSSLLGINISPLLGGRKNLHLAKIDAMTFRRGPGTNLNASDKPTGGIMKKFTDVGMDLLGSGSNKNSHNSSMTASESKFELYDIALTEHDIVSYVTIVTGLFKLMQFEQKLLEEVIAPEHHKAIFSRLIKDSLLFFFQEGDSLAQRVKKCSQKHDFSSALCLLPILRYHSHMRNHFDILLDGCDSNVVSKMPQLGMTLQTTISKSLEEFYDYVKQDDYTRVPKDGTVHELTSNVMMFLVNLNPYLDILGRVLMVPDMRSMEASTDKNRVAFSQYITRVLGILGMSLNKKADTYHDPILRSLFILNNNYYILKTLRKNELIEIVRLYQRDQVENNYQNLIARDKANYRRSWDRIMEYLLETKSPISQQKITSSPYYSGTLPGSASAHNLSAYSTQGLKLKDKDRQAIKDKFSGFNKEFEAIVATQRTYAVPDPDLRKELVQENIQLIVPKYNLFYDKYTQMDFTKNYQKYIRYSPDHVAQSISTFFDSAA